MIRCLCQFCHCPNLIYQHDLKGSYRVSIKEFKLLHTQKRTFSTITMVITSFSLSPEVEPRLSHGCTLVDNGTRTGMSKTVTLFNGDIKHVLEDGKVVSSAATSVTYCCNSDVNIDVLLICVLQVYYYAGSQITQTTYPSGLVVLHFPNKQIGKSAWIDKSTCFRLILYIFYVIH